MRKPNANYDETWKEAITQYFESFMLFFYPDLHAQINWHKVPKSLDKELEKITALANTEKRYADKLFQVWLLNDQEVWILIHIEVQSQYDKIFPMRMFIYNYRSFDLYNEPVISLAILGDNNKDWRPNSYQYGMGDIQVTMNFGIVKLTDYKWEELEKSENIFATVVMAHLKTKATTGKLKEREQWKWNLVRALYQKGFTKLDIINLVKFIDKMMTLSPALQHTFNTKLDQYEEELKMPFLSTIEENALKRGEQIGQQKGAKETCLDNILDLLKIRFNSVPETLETSLKQIDDLAKLKQLITATISVQSLGEFQDLINRNSPNHN